MKYRKPPAMLNEKQKTDVFGIVLMVACVLLAAAFLVNLWVLQNCYLVVVSGKSMNETLQDGDILYAYRYEEAERGDVIIINVEKYKDEMDFSGDRLIKRLIATEGDVVKIEGGVVYVKYAGESSFTQLEEAYALGASNDMRETEVGEGEIFFLGDNRLNSKDSRSVGCLLYSDIEGVVPQWSIDAKDAIKWWVHLLSFLGAEKNHTGE